MDLSVEFILEKASHLLLWQSSRFVRCRILENLQDFHANLLFFSNFLVELSLLFHLFSPTGVSNPSFSCVDPLLILPENALSKLLRVFATVVDAISCKLAPITCFWPATKNLIKTWFILTRAVLSGCVCLRWESQASLSLVPSCLWWS